MSGLARYEAATDPSSQDRRLRGRTYAIPFERVWTCALKVAGGAVRGWQITASNDESGIIDVSCTTMLWRLSDDVRITVGLDANAQTRVDVTGAARDRRPDLGRNARKIGILCRSLDQALEVKPGEILDPTLSPTWTPTS